MARPKEFDPQKALRDALELFWERGYESTSMSDLVERLGLGRASIYATFGSKRELYLAALNRYGELSSPNRLDLLSRPGPAVPAVCELVRRYATDATTDHRGCLVVNTAIELGPHDVVAAHKVQAHWSYLEAALTSAFMRARAQGELRGDQDPQALARFVLVFLQGLQVMARARVEPQLIQSSAEQVVALLNPETD